MKLSAKNDAALKQQAEQLAKYLDENADGSLADVCWSANTGWADFNQRAMIVAKDVDELTNRLRAFSGGEAASRFAELVALTDAMQQRLCAGAEVGLHYEALHDESHRQVGGILRQLGIVKTSAEEADKKGITRAFYPHGLGHALGLQTHDVGCAELKPRAENPFLRNTTVISEGQVFTIEPGIYFIEALLAPVRNGPQARDVDWKLVDALAPLGGVRIEDDVVVQSRGVRNLTREVLRDGGGRA